MRTPAVIRALRPKQWLKNTLVLAAPLSAGVLLDSHSWLPVATAFVTFCLSSSGVYLINDALDVESDRAHPTKRFRPIASGELNITTAVIVACVLLIAAPTLAFDFAAPGLAIIIVAYEVIQLSYCVWLKHAPVIDIVIVSSGFLIRAIGGALAVSVPVSQWFLLVAAFGSLFMVAGKRYSEKLSHTDGTTRRSLEHYSLSYLRFVWSMAAGLSLITYSLWAFEPGDFSTNPWPAVTLIPFTLALLRYAFEIDKGAAGAPEDTVLGDKVLLAFGFAWIALFTVSVVV